MEKVLVILGSTSTGKTDLALYLAKKLNGELVSCDSRQVYKGLDIGTGKAPSEMYNVQCTIYKKEGYWEIDGTKIWMYDVADPRKQYSAADYVKDAITVINGIVKRGKLPIIVGGTGFYLKALLEGVPTLHVPIDKKLRQQLNYLTIEQLQNKLKTLNPKRWKEMNNSDRQNPRRLMRAIEVARAKPKEDQKSKIKDQRYDTLKIGLIAPREILYQRSDDRVIDRVKQGMVEEAKRLHKEELSLERMKQLGLEYGVLADYLSGRIKTKSELIKILQLEIHGYIRRQLTWFKKQSSTTWFNITDKDFISKVEGLAVKWYHSP